MGIGIEGSLNASPVHLRADEPSTQYTKSKPIIGFGPSGSQPRRQPRQSASVLFGIFATAVAAVMFSAGIPTTAHAQTKAPPSTEVRSDSLRAGYARLLAADIDGDKKWIGTRYGNELGGLDPLGKAIFDFIDYVNPRGQSSLWGPATAGDYLTGGLGMGYSMRPKHMTGNAILLADDLDNGIRRLERQIANPIGTDQVATDLRAIMAGGASLGDIHAAAERLLDIIVKETGKKEIATRTETALLTDAELLALLPKGSLELAIAEAASGHGPVYFTRELRDIRANGRAWGMADRQETGVIGDAQQQYLLQIAKRAMEAKLLGDVQALL